jgi:hypothetical protein
MRSVPPALRTFAALVAAAALLTFLSAARPAPREAPVKLTPDSLRSLSHRHSETLSDLRFIQARLALAEQESLYLVLDGPRKTLSLELGGVPLRVCALRALRLDRQLERERRSAAFQESAAEPFPLVRREGTVTEHPPPMDVDTTDAAKQWREEERMRDVRFTLFFGRELAIHVTTNADESGGPTGFIPRMKTRWRWVRTSLRQWTGAATNRPEPADLFLLMDRRDALAIYRALPEKTGLALKL